MAEEMGLPYQSLIGRSLRDAAVHHRKPHMKRAASICLRAKACSLMKQRLTHAAGNVSINLEFNEAEARVLQLRANLMSDLRLHIERRRLTQAQAAKA